MNFKNSILILAAGLILSAPTLSACSNEGESTALHRAIPEEFDIDETFDITPILTLLKNPKINIHAKDDDDHTPLFKAVFYNNIAAVKALLTRSDLNINLNTNGTTPLMFAAECGHIEIVKVLLADPRTDIHANNKGKTALHSAVSYESEIEAKNCIQVVKTLLAHRPQININARDVNGKTALGLIFEHAYGSDHIAVKVYYHIYTLLANAGARV